MHYAEKGKEQREETPLGIESVEHFSLEERRKKGQGAELVRARRWRSRKQREREAKKWSLLLTCQGEMMDSLQKTGSSSCVGLQLQDWTVSYGSCLI